MNKMLPTLFISHGGGPWPWMDDMRSHFKMTEVWLKKIGEAIRPQTILMISGHWEENDFTVSTSMKPPMIYDYYGFPEHTYQVKYNAPGSVEVANRVKQLLSEASIPVKEKERGLDHGTFVPLHVMYPKADIPVAQLSLNQNLDPALHYQVGEILRPLREEGVLIIGSGLSYHNLRAFFHGGEETSKKFEEWLTKTIESDPTNRKKQLLHWLEAPGARASHPREDHLIPLMVVAGAASEDFGSRLFLDNAFGVAMASYQFGSSGE